MSGFPGRTLLVISLAVNLLVIGAAAGAYSAGLRLERAAPGAPIERMPGPRAFMAALPPATRDKIREDFVSKLAETRQLRATARQAHADALEAARTEPYDVERVRQAFSRMRIADSAVAASFQDEIARSFATLTPEERHQALEALRQAQQAPFRERMRERRRQGMQDQQNAPNGDAPTP